MPQHLGNNNSTAADRYETLYHSWKCMDQFFIVSTPNSNNRSLSCIIETNVWWLTLGKSTKSMRLLPWTFWTKFSKNIPHNSLSLRSGYSSFRQLNVQTRNTKVFLIDTFAIFKPRRMNFPSLYIKVKPLWDTLYLWDNVETVRATKTIYISYILSKEVR